MKFHVEYLLKGPARTIKCPNDPPILEAANLKILMMGLAPKFPDGQNDLKVEVIGLLVKPIEEKCIQEHTMGELRALTQKSS